MATAQTIVDEVKSEAGFDVTDAQALAWVDRRHKRMVARARSRRSTVTIGTTVAGTAFYSAASAGIVEAYYFAVGGTPYGRARHRDVYSYAQGGLVWSGQGTEGLLVVDASSSAVTGLTLIPTPDTAGDAITAYAAVKAATLALADTVLVDDEFIDVLVEGAIATGAARFDEDLSRADRLEARFDAGCEEYRRATEKRYRGSAPAQIRVVGINA